MGLKNVLHAPPEAILTSTFLTFPLGLGKVLTTTHWLSLSNTRSPSSRLGLSDCHFFRPCRVERYWFFQRCQNTLERCCTCLHWRLYRSLSLKLPEEVDGTPTFWVRRVTGVRISGKVGSVDTGTSGRELTMAVTSARKVVNTSWISCFGVMPAIIESCIRLVPIMRSQLPPMCEA